MINKIITAITQYQVNTAKTKSPAYEWCTTQCIANCEYDSVSFKGNNHNRETQYHNAHTNIEKIKIIHELAAKNDFKTLDSIYNVEENMELSEEIGIFRYKAGLKLHQLTPPADSQVLTCILENKDYRQHLQNPSAVRSALYDPELPANTRLNILNEFLLNETRLAGDEDLDHQALNASSGSAIILNMLTSAFHRQDKKVLINAILADPELFLHEACQKISYLSNEKNAIASSNTLGRFQYALQTALKGDWIDETQRLKINNILNLISTPDKLENFIESRLRLKEMLKKFNPNSPELLKKIASEKLQPFLDHKNPVAEQVVMEMILDNTIHKNHITEVIDTLKTAKRFDIIDKIASLPMSEEQNNNVEKTPQAYAGKIILEYLKDSLAQGIDPSILCLDFEDPDFCNIPPSA